MTGAELWRQVEGYIDAQLTPKDPFAFALAASNAAGLAPYHVSPAQGKMLHIFARMQNAQKILEIGALAGYSALWMASGMMPGGRLATIESDARHVAVARANAAAAGLADVVTVHHGRALEVLSGLDGFAPLDLAFIDADKFHNADYFDAVLPRMRPGGLIIVDNTVRDGMIVDFSNDNPSVAGTRRLYERVAAEKRVTATALQTVGGKGYDGFLLAYVG